MAETPPDLAQPVAPLPGSCSGCGTSEPPDARGLCPTPNCRRFRTGNRIQEVHGGRARLTPGELTTRGELVEQLLAERGGRDRVGVILRVRISDYASAVVQLQKVAQHLEQEGPLTQAGRRRALVDVYGVFSARVERLGSDIPPPARTSPDTSGVEAMPTPALQQALDLLRREARGEALTERETGQLDILRAATRGDLKLSVDDLCLDAPAAEPELPATEPAAPGPRPAPEIEEPALGPLADGDELKQRDPATWRLLHFNDPTEVKRRAEEKTAEMLHSQPYNPFSHGRNP